MLIVEAWAWLYYIKNDYLKTWRRHRGEVVTWYRNIFLFKIPVEHQDLPLLELIEESSFYSFISQYEEIDYTCVNDEFSEMNTNRAIVNI